MKTFRWIAALLMVTAFGLIAGPPEARDTDTVIHQQGLPVTAPPQMKKKLLLRFIPFFSLASVDGQVPSSDPLLPEASAIRFVPPPPPKEVPPLDVRSSTTANFGTHRVTILRAAPSTLPDIPEPPVVRHSVSMPARNIAPRESVTISGSTFDGKLSRIEVWKPSSRTRHKAWCAWDVSLLAPFHQIVIDGKTFTLNLFVSPVGSTKVAQSPVGSTPPDPPKLEIGAILVPDGDAYTTRLLTAMRDSHDKHLLKLLEIRKAHEQYRRDAAAWHAANPPQPQDHTIWLKPHRGSRYLKAETNTSEEDRR
jgi:hypothetical protein